MMSRHFIRYWLPTIAMAVLIFIGSSLSWENVTLPEVWNIDKLIHMAEYGIFAFLIKRSFLNSKNNFLSRHSNSFAILTAGLYGITDELHQYFVPNRSMNFFDVCSDFLGAAIFIVVMGKLLKKGF